MCVSYVKVCVNCVRVYVIYIKVFVNCVIACEQ